MAINKMALLRGIVVGLANMFFIIALLAIGVLIAKKMVPIEGSNTEALNNLISLMSNKIMVWTLAIMSFIGWSSSTYQATIKKQKMQDKMVQQVQGLKEDFMEQKKKREK